MPVFRLIACFTLLSLAPVFCAVSPAAAWTEVTLTWSPNAEPDVAGYRVFSRLDGEDYDYETPAWEGTETSCTLDIWDETSRWCFVARAFDTEGFESADSNEACYEGTEANLKSTKPSPAEDEAVADQSDSSYGCFIHSLIN